MTEPTFRIRKYRAIHYKFRQQGLRKDTKNTDVKKLENINIILPFHYDDRDKQALTNYLKHTKINFIETNN